MAEKLNKLLMQGILPDGLNFGKNPYELDINKIKYNAFYRQYDYHLSKIPKALHKVPGIEQLVQEKMKNAVSPLEDIERREENLNVLYNEEEKRSEN
jgi:hypothetical protein